MFYSYTHPHYIEIMRVWYLEERTLVHNTDDQNTLFHIPISLIIISKNRWKYYNFIITNKRLWHQDWPPQFSCYILGNIQDKDLLESFDLELEWLVNRNQEIMAFFQRKSTNLKYLKSVFSENQVRTYEFK